MLNILRKNAQSVIIQGIVVVIAVVFVFWGVGGNLKDNSNAIAVVNGKEIAYRDFQQSYERAVETYKQQFKGQMPQGFIESIGLKEQVLNQLIQSELLRQGAEKMGIMISKEATQRKIQEMTVFTKDGHFALSNYEEILKQNKLTPKTFETGIQKDLLSNRASEAIKSFASISGKEVQNWIDYIEQEIKLAYTFFKSEDYISQVKIDENELQAWYATNKQNYKSLPQNKIQYLFFDYDNDIKQAAVKEDDVHKYYQENLDKFNVPEQRRARHILFKVAAADRPEIKAAKKAKAEKVMAEIKNKGDFAQLATRYSEDSSKDKGGDLGFFSRGKMVQPFEDTVFSLSKGETSGLVETSFGYHIIKLEEIMPAKILSVDEARGTIHKELEQQGGKAITFKRASTAYEDIIRAGSLAKYSEKSGYPIKTMDYFEQTNPPQDRIVQDRSFLQAVFALKKGELSSIVETSNGYAIIFIDDVKESMIPELSVVRERAVTDFKKIKSVDLARAAAENMLKTVKDNQSWPANIERKDSEYMKRFGSSASIPDQVRQDAFAHTGKMQFPEKAIMVNNTFYIYQIVDVRQGKDEMEKEKRQDFEEQLLAAQNNKLMEGWLDQLRKEAKIWTNAKMLQ